MVSVLFSRGVLNSSNLASVDFVQAFPCPISPPISLPFDSILPFSFNFFFFLMVKRRKEVYKENNRAGM